MNAILKGRALWRGKTTIALLLIAAMLLTPNSRVTQAQDSTNNIVIIDCTNPDTVWSTDCGPITRLEKEATADILRIHQLPEAHAVRVLVWQRNQIRALMFDKVLAIIKKASAERTADEAKIYDMMAQSLRDNRLQAALFSKTEYERWRQEGCVLIAKPAFKSGFRNSANWIKGEGAFASASAKRPTPKTAADNSATLSRPKLPRLVVMASAYAASARASSSVPTWSKLV